MTLAALSALIPASDRPRQPKKFLRLLQETVGDRIDINGNSISLGIQGSAFAERVVSLLGAASGNCMTVAALGALIPASDRPRQSKKFTRLLYQTVGDRTKIKAKSISLRF